MTPKEKRLSLGDGQSYLLRALRASDAGLLYDFFHTHTEETIYQRYGYVFRRMSHARALQLVSVDQERDLALAIFEAGESTIHAIGRYYLDVDGRSAEIAFVVREEKRRLGMCRELLAAMMETARARGLERLRALVLTTNTPMLRLLESAGGESSPEPDGQQVEVVLRL